MLNVGIVVDGADRGKTPNGRGKGHIHPQKQQKQLQQQEAEREREEGGSGNIRTTHVQLLFVVFSCSYIIIIKALNCFVVFTPARVAMLGEERRGGTIETLRFCSCPVCQGNCRQL